MAKGKTVVKESMKTKPGGLESIYFAQILYTHFLLVLV